MICARPLTAEAFAPWGEVLEAAGAHRLINAGMCRRFHDRARPDVEGGLVGLSVFEAEPRSLPYLLDMVERHPLGSQAFLPMTAHPFLVMVAEDGEAPGPVHAFVTAPGQGINLRRGAWHGVLAPLQTMGLFAVLDYVGDRPNLQEHRFAEPLTVTG